VDAIKGGETLLALFCSPIVSKFLEAILFNYHVLLLSYDSILHERGKSFSLDFLFLSALNCVCCYFSSQKSFKSNK